MSGEPPKICPNVALRVAMHAGESLMPEKPQVFLVCDWLGVENIMVKLSIGPQIQLIERDEVKSGGNCIRSIRHCEREKQVASLDVCESA